MTMKTFIKNGLRVTILLYTLIHLVTSFNEHPLLIELLSYIGVAIIILGVLTIPLRHFKLPLFILLIAMIILVYSQTNILSGILLGVQEMRNVIGILVIIPLISWVLQEEPYIEDMMSVFHNFINSSKKFYFTMISLTQVLTYFLLFGSITMMYQFIDIILKDQKSEMWQRYKGSALLRGYGLSTLWVITVPSFIVVVDTLGASIYISIAQGFGIALVGTFLAVLFVAPTERKHNLNITPILQTEINNVLLTASTDIKTRKQNVVEFFLLFFSLFGAIFFIYSFWNIPLLTLIPLTIIGWIMTFYLYKRRLYKLKSIAKQYFSIELGKKAYQVALMLSIGTLIYSLNQTDFAENVVGGLNAIENNVSWLNPLYLLPFIVIVLGLMGLGPLTVMVLVAGILKSLNLPYPPELIVLAITSGSVISILISPVLMPLIVLSDSNGLNLFTNGIKSNWKYALAFFIVTQIYIQLMMHIW